MNSIIIIMEIFSVISLESINSVLGIVLSIITIASLVGGGLFLKRRSFRRDSVDRIKEKTRVLFVDDREFEVVDILKNAGWQNIDYKNDIDNIGCDIVKNSDVIFVDVNGVGKKLFRNEGIGLAAAIKKRYPKKRVIIYSAVSDGNRLDPDLSVVDGILEKNAEPIQFSAQIEQVWKK